MPEATAIPLNMYENERELLVSAPMPGIGPEDVEIEVDEDRRITFRARQHGEGQERIDYLLREWAYGPYERSAELPRDVDAPRANVSLGNGVLVVTLPKADATVPGRLRIDRHGMARGMTVGHVGTRGGAPAD